MPGEAKNGTHPRGANRTVELARGAARAPGPLHQMHVQVWCRVRTVVVGWSLPSLRESFELFGAFSLRTVSRLSVRLFWTFFMSSSDFGMQDPGSRPAGAEGGLISPTRLPQVSRGIPRQSSASRAAHLARIRTAEDACVRPSGNGWTIR